MQFRRNKKSFCYLVLGNAKNLHPDGREENRCLSGAFKGSFFLSYEVFRNGGEGGVFGFGGDSMLSPETIPHFLSRVRQVLLKELLKLLLGQHSVNNAKYRFFILIVQFLY